MFDGTNILVIMDEQIKSKRLQIYTYFLQERYAVQLCQT